MNKVILVGRLAKDVDVRYTQDGSKATARYSIAVQRDYKTKNGQYEADFLNCMAFGKNAEFADKYLHKGMKILVEGRIITGSYEAKDGHKVYTTDIVVDKHEFVEPMNASSNQGGNQSNAPAGEGFEGFMDVAESNEEGLPFA